MALKSGGTTFLDDSRNYTASSNTALANDAYILIANNSTVTDDGYSITGTKAIADDGFAFNQFDVATNTVSFLDKTLYRQGESHGYLAGSYTNGQPFGPVANVIEKFSFVSDGNSTDVGDLTDGRLGMAGASSNSNGYATGGAIGPSTNTRNVIEKFPFATDANATDAGNLTVSRSSAAGMSSVENGYAVMGVNFSLSPVYTNVIDKFPFAADEDATDVGDLTQGRYHMAGHQSETFGYVTGGGNNPASNKIEKFPFATDANATDVGDLTSTTMQAAGHQSDVSGYVSGGRGPSSPDLTNKIDKFPFATDADATDVGDLTVSRYGPGGSSSTESGYAAGGWVHLTIDKFPFATDANATDVGDLIANGQQKASNIQH